MAMSLLLAQRVLVMFALAGVGFAMFRAGKITLEGNRTIGNILIYLSLPAVIIKSLMVGRTVENAVALAEGAAVALVLIVVAALVARLTCRRDGIGNFAGTFSNPSFFGIPLIAATIGEACVFYNAGFIFLMNIGQWTYGVSLLTGERERISWRDVLLAPFTIAMLVGLVLFSAQPPLPVVVTDCLGFVADLNTPLAMFSLGVYLAQVNPRAMFRRVANYRVSLARLVVAPLVSLAILTLLPLPSYEMRMALLIAASCPVGSNVAVYAQLHDSDYAYAVETVVISVLLSIVTIPVVVGLANALWL